MRYLFLSWATSTDYRVPVRFTALPEGDKRDPEAYKTAIARLPKGSAVISEYEIADLAAVLTLVHSQSSRPTRLITPSLSSHWNQATMSWSPSPPRSCSSITRNCASLRPKRTLFAGLNSTFPCSIYLGRKASDLPAPTATSDTTRPTLTPRCDLPTLATFLSSTRTCPSPRASSRLSEHGQASTLTFPTT